MSKLLKNLMIHAKLRMGDGDEGEASRELPTNELGEVAGSGNEARLAMLSRISDSTDQARGDELRDVNDDGSTSDFSMEISSEDEEARAAREAEETEAARVAAEEEAAVAAKAAEGSTAEPAPKLTRMINGREVEITDEMLARALQVDHQNDTAVREAAAQAAREAATQAEQEENDRLARIVRAIQLGTEEEALEAVKQLKQSTAPVQNLDALIEHKLTVKEATAKFAQDFSDIVSDPVLMDMAIRADLALDANGDRRSLSERYTAIGNDIRKWVSSKAPQQQQSAEPAAGAPATSVAKQERKAAAPAFPKAAGGKHAPTAEEEKEESASDIIADIAKKRGGPQWMNGASR